MTGLITIVFIGLVALLAWKPPDDRDRTGGHYRSSMDDYM